MDSYLASELGATTPEEYTVKKAEVQALVEQLRADLKSVTSMEELLQKCREVAAKSDRNRPVWIGDAYSNLTAEQLGSLRTLGYPEEFLTWIEQHGDLYLDLEQIRVVNGARVWEELHGDWHGLLMCNGYYFLTSDGSGNAYLWDSQSPEPRFLFADHDEVYIRLDSLDELYSERLDFWEEEDGFHNPNGLDVSLIFNEAGELRPDSKYVRDYLGESLEVMPVSSFLELVLRKFDEGLSYLYRRY